MRGIALEIFKVFGSIFKSLANTLHGFYLRLLNNLELFKFFLTDGPNCDTNVVSNARKVALTPKMC